MINSNSIFCFIHACVMRLKEYHSSTIMGVSCNAFIKVHPKRLSTWVPAMKLLYYRLRSSWMTCTDQPFWQRALSPTKNPLNRINCSRNVTRPNYASCVVLSVVMYDSFKKSSCHVTIYAIFNRKHRCFTLFEKSRWPFSFPKFIHLTIQFSFTLIWPWTLARPHFSVTSPV